MDIGGFNYKKLTKEQKNKLTELYIEINNIIKKEFYFCELSTNLKFKAFSLLNYKYQNDYKLKYDFEFYNVLENVNVGERKLTYHSNLDRFNKSKACPIEIIRLKNKRIELTEKFIKGLFEYLEMDIDISDLDFFEQMFVLENYNKKVIKKEKR